MASLQEEILKFYKYLSKDSTVTFEKLKEDFIADFKISDPMTHDSPYSGKVVWNGHILEGDIKIAQFGRTNGR